MATEIIMTPTDPGPSEIGWVTVAEADSYFGTRFGASSWWTSGADKEGALQTAYHQLNDCGRFSFPTTATAAMKRGQYEQALFLLIHGADADRRMGLQAQGVRSAGIVQEAYELIGDIPISLSALSALRSGGHESRAAAYLVELERDEDA